MQGRVEGGKKSGQSQVKMWVRGDYGIPAKVEVMEAGVLQDDCRVQKYKSRFRAAGSIRIASRRPGYRYERNDEANAGEAVVAYKLKFKVEGDV